MATAFLPSTHAKQGIKALMNGIQIGGTTIMTGDGTPAALATALRIGDIYVDYTNGALYVATATGTGGWVTFAALASSATTFAVGTNLTVGGTAEITGTLTQTGVATFTAAPVLPTASLIGGSKINTYAGTPEAHVTGSRKGDLCVDYTNGALYVFAGTATQNTGWKLVTQAA